MSSTVKICHADLEHGIDMSGEASISLSNANDGRECRICHMDLESERHLYGIPIELGCSCKNDLAAAHKLCAETWFRSQGRRTCEICHSVAQNVFATNGGTTENLRDNYNAITLSTTRTRCLNLRFLEVCFWIIFFIAIIIMCVVLPVVYG